MSQSHHYTLRAFGGIVIFLISLCLLFILLMKCYRSHCGVVEDLCNITKQSFSARPCRGGSVRALEILNQFSLTLTVNDFILMIQSRRDERRLN